MTAPRPAGRPANAPATRKQTALWLLETLVPGSGANNLSVAFAVDGRLDRAAVERTVGLLLRRHEVLRTVFSADPTGLTRRVLPPGRVAVRIEEILPADEPDKALQSFVAQPFELNGEPLVRAGLLPGADGDTCCVVVHHLVFDAISVGILLREFVAGYEAVVAGDEFPAVLRHIVPSLPEATPTPRGLEFWRDHLTGFDPAALDLAVGRRDAASPTLIGGQVGHTLDAEVTAAVRDRQRDLRAPEAVILYAAYYLLLIAHGAGRDLVVGSPMNTRRQEDRDAIGYHVNVAPLRARADPGMSFRDLVLRVRDDFLEAIGHADVSLDDFSGDLPRRGSAWRDTILRHLFNYVSGMSVEPFTIAGRPARPVLVENGFSKFDLEFFVVSAPDAVWIRAVHYTEVLDAADARLLLERYETLLRLVTADIDAPVGALPVWAERIIGDDAEPARPAAPTGGCDERVVGELTDLWRALLDKPDLDADAHFFASGGNSLLAAQLAQKVGEVTGVRPKLADVFAQPTPYELAAFLHTRQQEATAGGKGLR